MVPLRGVEHPSLEALDPRDVGQLGLAQRAHAGDEEVGGEAALVGLDSPDLGFVVPGGLGDGVVVADVRVEPVLGRAVAQVVPDLRLGREGAAPARVRLEGEGVEMRGDVAGAAGIGVVAPGAAEVARPLQDHEVVHAGLLQADAAADAREAAARDREANMLWK